METSLIWVVLKKKSTVSILVYSRKQPCTNKASGQTSQRDILPLISAMWFLVILFWIRAIEDKEEHWILFDYVKLKLNKITSYIRSPYALSLCPLEGGGILTKMDASLNPRFIYQRNASQGSLGSGFKYQITKDLIPQQKPVSDIL